MVSYEMPARRLGWLFGATLLAAVPVMSGAGFAPIFAASDDDVFAQSVEATLAADDQNQVDEQAGDEQTNNSDTAAQGLYRVFPNHVFVPAGLNDASHVQVVLDGWKNASCDSVLDPKVTVYQSKTISVDMTAQPPNVWCLPVLTRFTQVVDLGVLPAGKYKIISNDGWLVQPFEVLAAEPNDPADDDFAIITSVKAQHHEGTDPLAGWDLVINGLYHATCEQLKDVGVVNSGLTIEVEMLVEMTSQPLCSPTQQPFMTRVKLPNFAAPGRYLVHVRSRGETAFNVVVSAGVQDVARNGAGE